MINTNWDSYSPAFRVHLQAKPGAEYRRGLLRSVSDALHRGERRVVVDCSSWAEFDLVLVSALVQCARSCQDHGADFELENLDLDKSNRIEALRIADRLGMHV